MSAPSAAKASTKWRPKRVRLRSRPLRVAVMMVRLGPESASTKGPDALAVLTKVTRRSPSPSSSVLISAGVRSGPGMLKRAVRSRKVPWPRQQHDQVVAGRHRGGDLAEGGSNVVGGRAGADAGGIEVGLLAQVGDALGRDAVLLGGRVGEAAEPPVERVGVAGLAAEAGDEEDVGVLGARGCRDEDGGDGEDGGDQGEAGDGSCRGRNRGGRRPCRLRRRPFSAGGRGRSVPRGTGQRRRGNRAALHANPFFRRYPHSAPSSPASSRNSSGMSHRSRSSVTVTPPPVYRRSSGSRPAVSAV